MIIYNVTAKIDHDIHDDWLKWMREKHIPDMIKTGLFSNPRLSRVISLRDDDGLTYAIQYECNSTSVLHQYEIKHAPALRKEYAERYAGKSVVFRSIMEVIE